MLQLVGRANPETKPLADWLRKARPDAVAVGNGTGGREALDAVRDAVREAGVEVVVVSVSESGASIYSASDLAREELPDVDLTVRGAVHIARRLQDPLAELVKVPPQSIGVGQYQHDVDQGKLGARLAETVESCVNRVGVDANTASPALLAYVAGIGPKLARAIVAHREKAGGFGSRKQLLDVAGLGPKTYEQCAGFLRVRGANPLDASGVHPERYTLVAKMAKDLGVPVGSLVGDAAAVARIELRRYEDADTGRATLTDIAAELAKPGRDPREQFEAPEFRDDVREIGDLAVGMVLEGVVTNVTNFGAFVDIGVHQDGLVHVSQLSDKFVRSPHEVVTAGQRLTVKVLSVDAERRRIAEREVGSRIRRCSVRAGGPTCTDDASEPAFVRHQRRGPRPMSQPGGSARCSVRAGAATCTNRTPSTDPMTRQSRRLSVISDGRVPVRGRRASQAVRPRCSVRAGAAHARTEHRRPTPRRPRVGVRPSSATVGSGSRPMSQPGGSAGVRFAQVQPHARTEHRRPTLRRPIGGVYP